LVSELEAELVLEAEGLEAVSEAELVLEAEG
jgi:hypothetical protein